MNKVLIFFLMSILISCLENRSEQNFQYYFDYSLIDNESGMFLIGSGEGMIDPNNLEIVDEYTGDTVLFEATNECETHTIIGYQFFGNLVDGYVYKHYWNFGNGDIDTVFSWYKKQSGYYYLNVRYNNGDTVNQIDIKPYNCGGEILLMK